jgi:uncharacterized membrane protein
MLIFWGAVAWGVVWLVRTPRDQRRPDNAAPAGIDRPGQGAEYASARRLLDERYANGELSDEEYRKRRDLLDLR